MKCLLSFNSSSNPPCLTITWKYEDKEQELMQPSFVLETGVGTKKDESLSFNESDISIKLYFENDKIGMAETCVADLNKKIQQNLIKIYPLFFRSFKLIDCHGFVVGKHDLTFNNYIKSQNTETVNNIRLNMYPIPVELFIRNVEEAEKNLKNTPSSCTSPLL